MQQAYVSCVRYCTPWSAPGGKEGVHASCRVSALLWETDLMFSRGASCPPVRGRCVSAVRFHSFSDRSQSVSWLVTDGAETAQGVLHTRLGLGLDSQAQAHSVQGSRRQNAQTKRRSPLHTTAQLLRSLLTPDKTSSPPLKACCGCH